MRPRPAPTADNRPFAVTCLAPARVLLVAAVALLSAVFARAGTPPREPLHLFWPRFPRPARILTIKSIPSPEAAIFTQTLAGLMARAVKDGRGSEMIWYPNSHPMYVRWLRAAVAQTGAAIVGPLDIWTILDRERKAGIVRGYILYRYDTSKRAFHEAGEADTSVNYATSMCGPLHAVAIGESLEARARAHGLKRLLDVRGRREEDALTTRGVQFGRDTVAMIEPKVNEIRDEAVALDAVTLSAFGPAYETALSRVPPDVPVLGWGRGDEFRQTEPSTRWGDFQTATNWCENLPVLSTETPGKSFPAARLRGRPAKSLWDLSWDTGVHYASFVMSDGDNVQWLMGNFLEDDEHAWWAAPSRGRFPMGWTFCYADLAQLCPYALDYLYRTAAPNDDFVLLGGGYYYPDLFGKSRPGLDAAGLHASRLAPYVRMGGVKLLMFNAQIWDSPNALAAYGTFARAIPDLEGVLTVQYAPYTGGGGAVRWVSGAGGSSFPVISARFAIWADANDPRQGTPREVAAMLNKMPRAGAPDKVDHFSWVVVHAWSYFSNAGEAASAAGGKRRGLEPVRACVDALAPGVVVVKPTEMAQLMRLRLRPRQTLDRALSDLEARIAASQRAQPRSPSSLVRRLRAAQYVSSARLKLRAGDFQNSFKLGCHAYRTLIGGTPL